jgi:glutamate-ammonia-ligase adenylyltransferase
VRVTTKRRAAATSLADRIVPRLVPAGPAERKAGLAELRDAARSARADDLVALLGQRDVAAFVASVMAYAPFLRGLILDDPARLAAILATDPSARLAEITSAAARVWIDASEAELMAALRRARQDVALTVGLADLAGAFDLAAVTAGLAGFADAAISAATRLLLRDAAAAGRIALPNDADPAARSGWIVLGMGKLGANELNYSSDVDLIVLYDAAVARTGETDPQQLFVRLTQRLVAILAERTADGYVFRVDLRLRPDPGATAIAMSTEAALLYYEGFGQNWERAALIKARPVAGDIAAGDAFLGELTPYIWRKYLDYAAIADIHSIKRQIHDHRGHGEVAVAGHNVKLGRGGIREIEFFVQTQQLIAGGRNPTLRGRATVESLAALADSGWIDAATRDDLTRAYRDLRTVEHCLQMVGDEQNHALPEEDVGLAVIARMAGYRDVPAFSEALTATLTTVSGRYAALFEKAAALTSTVGSLVFTGDADDPATLATLTQLGYRRPSDVTRIVREWHFGRYPAVRSASARERLTEFVPLLIETLSKTDNADAAFLAFDRFLSRVPAGGQLFALLQSNPQLLALLATILAVAPRLAETVVQRTHVLDTLIEPDFFGRLPDREALATRLAATAAEARSYEEVLDRARVFRQEQAFLIGVRLLAGTVAPHQAGRAYSDLADVIVARLVDAVRREFAAAHGNVAGGAVAVLAMGRLGGREMTAASDLDLILLYDYDERASASDGKRPLPPALYFTRLTQRLVAALSAPTGEGTLYSVDFRLRPSGKSGPLATHIEAFATYQAKDAWTWEHMALTRARAIAGDARLIERARDEIARIIRQPRDPEKVRADVVEMRGMVEAAKGGEGTWDLKQAPGGLVDIEFIAQTLQLVHARTRPEVISTDTETALSQAAAAGLLPEADADVLLSALRLDAALLQILRLCVEEDFDPATAPAPLLARLAEAADMPDFRTLEAHLRATQRAVRTGFERLVGKMPAAAVAS